MSSRTPAPLGYRPSGAIDHPETHPMFDGELASEDRRQFLADGRLADEIEQCIMRAYVQLVFQPEGNGRVRTLTVRRSGTMEVRLTELPHDRIPEGVPPFWLEVFSAEGPTLDGLGFFDFDDSEMTSAVELIIDAMREYGEPVAAGRR